MSKYFLCKIIIIAILLQFVLFLIIPHIEVRPNKNNINLLAYKEVYKEKGACVYLCNAFNCDFISDEVSISTIDPNDLGEYEVKYEYTYKDKNYVATRNVKVIDIIEPSIDLVGYDKVYLSLNSNYIEYGAIANDNYDGNLNDKIVISGNVDTSKVGTYTIHYSVKDSSNNESSIIREIIVYDDMKEFSISNREIEIIRDLESYINDNKLKVSIIYYDILSGYTYTYNPNKVYYGCSLIKTLDAMYIYENIKLTDKLRSLVKKAIEVSDNDSHYSLVSTISKSELKNYGEKIGAKNVLTTKDTYGNTTVYDQLVYMKHLFKLIYTLDSGYELMSYFVNDFKRYVDFEGAPLILHKYGRINSVYYHESAIILDEHPYIVSILSEEDRRKNVITELSKKIFDMHNIIKEVY